MSENILVPMVSPSNSGFLLTRSAKDTPQGIVITLWLKTALGPFKLLVNNEQAIFFVEQAYSTYAEQALVKQNISISHIKSLPLKTFNQQLVTAFYFNSMRDFYIARDYLKQQDIKCYEDDFRPDDRYLMERFITADIEFVGKRLEKGTKNETNHRHVNTFQVIEYAQCKKPIPALVADEDKAISVTMLSIDLECSMDGDLYSIGLFSDSHQSVLMIGDEPDESGTDYITWLPDERALLQVFISRIAELDPDILIGWNVINFDMALLQKRYDKAGIVFSIGRDGSKPYWRSNKVTDQQYIEIAGRVVLDGIDLLKTATYSFPSFSLDNVANALLGRGKKVDDVENRMDEINNNFLNNKPALAAYNLEDCRLVWLIFEKTHLLKFAMLRAKLTGLSIDRVGGSVAAFTNLYLPQLHRSGYVAPNMGDGASELVPPGGFVMDSIPGLYNNVLVLDFKSLYPSIIRSFNIDPMGLIEGLRDHEINLINGEPFDKSLPPIEGFDGAYFSRTQHFLPEMIKSLWRERDIAKADKNTALSQAIKIIMNSFYGILGSTGCRFFDPRLAGSITKRSHQLLKTTKRWIEEKGFTVIYGDTDSIFVNIGKDKTAKQSKAIGKDLQDFINICWHKKLKDDFFIESELEIEFETHYSKFFMPTIRGGDVSKTHISIGTKKRYAGLVNDKLIFKGLESVRSDWTELSKEFQKKLYQLIFNEEAVEEYIKKIVDELRSGQHDDKLIYSKKIRRKLSDYMNTPPHIKAAHIANQKLKSLGKEESYQHRKTICYVMSLNGVQPIEFNDSKLDYDFYVSKQLKPIADDILPFIGKSFESITSNQLGFFDF